MLLCPSILLKAINGTPFISEMVVAKLGTADETYGMEEKATDY